MNAKGNPDPRDCLIGKAAAAWLPLFSEEMPAPMNAPRAWQSAQRAEKEFWQSWRRNPLYATTDLPSFWRQTLEKTGARPLAGMVLDLGCGPVPALNFHRPHQAIPLGLDPLAAFYASSALVEHDPALKPMPMLACGGETIPLRSAVVDHILCFNVLDHTAAAPAVLAEMHRVLKPEGSVHLYVHTFTPWITPFLFWDTPHVYHWSRKRFARLLMQSGFRIVTALHERKSFAIPPGVLNQVRLLPFRVAAHTTWTSYFHLVPAAKRP